jgi:hypothetical protein
MKVEEGFRIPEMFSFRKDLIRDWEGALPRAFNTSVSDSKTITWLPLCEEKGQHQDTISCPLGDSHGAIQ